MRQAFSGVTSLPQRVIRSPVYTASSAGAAAGDAAGWACAATGASARRDAVIKKLRILCPVELGEPRTQRGAGGSWARAPAAAPGAGGGVGTRLRALEGGAAPGRAPPA